MPAHTLVCREGEYDKQLYFVRRGSLLIKRQNRVYAELGPGEFVGEIAALLNMPRTASVEARTRSQLLCCPAEDLESLFKSFQVFKNYLIDLASKRLIRLTNT